MSLPLRLKIRLGIVIGSLCIPILFLFVTMIPNVFMVETSFINLDNLSIDGPTANNTGPGVTHISWGIWKACYTVNNQTTCTPTHWITNPYTFAIFEDNPQLDRGFAAVQQSWQNTLFLHFVAIFYAISIGLFHIVRYYYKKILSSKNTNFLTLSLIIWMTIILIGDYAVLQSIKNGLEILDPGGDALVITNPGSGFWLTVTAYLLTLFFLFLTCCYPLQGRSTKATNQETRIPETRIPETKSIPLDPLPSSNPGMGTPGLASHDNIRNGPGIDQPLLNVLIWTFATSGALSLLCEIPKLGNPQIRMNLTLPSDIC